MNEKLKKVIDCVDLNKLAVVVVEEIVEDALKKVVEDTENKFAADAFAYVFPLLKKELLKLVEEKAKEI